MPNLNKDDNMKTLLDYNIKVGTVIECIDVKGYKKMPSNKARDKIITKHLVVEKYTDDFLFLRDHAYVIPRDDYKYFGISKNQSAYGHVHQKFGNLADCISSYKSTLFNIELEGHKIISSNMWVNHIDCIKSVHEYIIVYGAIEKND